MPRFVWIVLIAGLYVSGCSETPKTLATDMMPGDGAVAMQAAPEEARDRAAARLVCGKAGLEEGTPLFERCVSAYRDRQRVLSRAEARQRRTRALRVRQLCLEPGEFILVQCLEI